MLCSYAEITMAMKERQPGPGWKSELPHDLAATIISYACYAPQATTAGIAADRLGTELYDICKDRKGCFKRHTFDPADKGSCIVLSDNGHTAFHNGSSPGWNTIRA